MSKLKSRFLALLACVTATAANNSVMAQQDCAAICDGCDSAAVSPSLGYTGCLWERTKFSGDWLGTRTALAETGMVWDIDQTLFGFGVASGGLNETSTFAGHGDYLMNWDLEKAGLNKGLFLKTRAEHRYGRSIGGFDGAFLPSTIQAELPTADSENIYLTNVLLTQFLSEEFAVFAGKLDTFDGDPNPYAGGRGKEQFSNLAFVVNPMLLRAVPYSTLGTGFIYMKDQIPIFNFSVINPIDTAKTIGLDELFSEGVAITSQATLPYEIGGLSGQHTFGGAWSSRDYVSLGQDPRILIGDFPIARQNGTWGLYWNTSQQLVNFGDKANSSWGYFARAGIAEDHANPLSYFLSAGLGGNSPLAGRAQDRWGVGYYYLATSNRIGPILQAALGPIGDSQGVEMFYNYQFAPSIRITPDMQILKPEREDLDTALLLGVRANVDF